MSTGAPGQVVPLIPTPDHAAPEGRPVKLHDAVKAIRLAVERTDNLADRLRAHLRFLREIQVELGVGSDDAEREPLFQDTLHGRQALVEYLMDQIEALTGAFA